LFSHDSLHLSGHNYKNSSDACQTDKTTTVFGLAIDYSTGNARCILMLLIALIYLAGYNQDYFVSAGFNKHKLSGEYLPL
jgi:hypothetical protein